jgi:hypothetical protein
MKTNLRLNRSQCELILAHHYEVLRVEYHPEICRVVGYDNFIKLECFSAQGNSKFRVRIEVESIPDNEVIEKYEFITPLTDDKRQPLLPFE